MRTSPKPRSTALRTPKFQLGQTVQTANASHTLNPLIVMHALTRHQSGDWGNCDPEDAKTNNRALASGKDRIFSVYQYPNQPKFWIITEWDRSVTTVLLPEDY